jgi:phenylpyruvate tautomerase PptA (4-oxalocrotonate tautomerase family)
MPYLLVKTNHVVEPSQQAELLKRCSQAVAGMLGKPERYVMVSIESGSPMIFGGDTAPCAYLELKSLGLPEEKSADYSTVLCELINDAMGIPPERIYIEFSSPARHMWGWNSGTF